MLTDLSEERSEFVMDVVLVDPQALAELGICGLPNGSALTIKAWVRIAGWLKSTIMVQEDVGIRRVCIYTGVDLGTNVPTERQKFYLTIFAPNYESYICPSGLLIFGPCQTIII